MKAIILVTTMVFVSLLSGCAIAPYGVGGQQGQHQSAMGFAAQQAADMKTEGNKFMRNALSDEGVCNGAAGGTPSQVYKDADISNQNGGVSFRIYYDGNRRIVCDK
ncbi:MAG: hypothetical protein RLZZ230_934 [Candidatus Parcubacteria bacterium]|jgi:hypothetical protein